ncbi:uncharacterized protein LOC122863071 isoform X3 [Siniperca chuatsi]|uniref:uncharacterized protein LOC122863071 isoform X2 n=1 Tax=Siniperca chuatsi TaxID=119488 RepID=UPI001CE2223F|nr:uncharacterized protein LOC122863071 isoform X2 [Siniperca chuatsi]XP_044025114.1 uncharacterized protein LOC122863071 isoform X3 [Siniperca chuatsi]
MAEFKWISLFLIAVLQFTAAERLPLSFTVRVGDEVTLPCENVTDGQRKCDSTTWLFSDSRYTAAVDLIYLGQIVERAKAQSDRLSVTASCSLVIKNVTVEDVGLYTCRQFRSRRQQAPDSLVHLSVVTMTEHQDTDKVTFTCSVSTFERCGHTVKWLYEGEDVAKDNKDLVTSQSLCRASVRFLTSHYSHTSRSNFLTCLVTDGNKEQFPYRLRPSGEKPGEDTTTATTESTTTTENSRKAARTDCSALSYIMLVMRVAELLLITAITVLLIRARGNQRPPDDNTVLNSVRSRTVKRSGPAASQVQDDVTVNYEN